MKYIAKTALLFSLIAIAFAASSQKKASFKSSEVYKSGSLVVTQISPNTFVHTSFKKTNDFGNVPCNGLVVRDSNEVIVFDTPTNDSSANELISWIGEKLHCKINAIIPTHFHDDCLGGLKAFDEKGISSYGYTLTIELAKKENYLTPKNSFNDSLVLKVGGKYIVAKYLGEGHTRDNIVGYFPSEKVLFGGCMIKELNAGKGYLADANLAEWSNTVMKVKREFPEAKIIIPGHGQWGNRKLLDYTIKMFRKTKDEKK